jgi:hypothetical protein
MFNGIDQAAVNLGTALLLGTTTSARWRVGNGT